MYRGAEEQWDAGWQLPHMTVTSHPPPARKAEGSNSSSLWQPTRDERREETYPSKNDAGMSALIELSARTRTHEHTHNAFIFHLGHQEQLSPRGNLWLNLVLSPLNNTVMYFPPNKVTVTPPSGKCSEHKDKRGEALIQVQAKNTQSQRQFEGKRMNSFEEN